MASAYFTIFSSVVLKSYFQLNSSEENPISFLKEEKSFSEELVAPFIEYPQAEQVEESKKTINNIYMHIRLMTISFPGRLIFVLCRRKLYLPLPHNILFDNA